MVCARRTTARLAVVLMPAGMMLASGQSAAALTLKASETLSTVPSAEGSALKAEQLATPVNAKSARAKAEKSPWKLSAETSVQGRGFAQNGAYAGQSGAGFSLALEPEIDYAIPKGSIRFVAFARWDQRDDERTHVDLREFNLRQRRGNFDLLIGVGHVFWGTTESVHLVDIINQTDLVENPDGEDKLGQPMINLSWSSRDYGVLSGFVLPYFRERSLPGERGRLRAPVPFDRGEASFESADEQRHVDAALRWSLSRGPVDLGLSHFSGTAREPSFLTVISGNAAQLQPFYAQIEQSGLDANVVSGGWLWKLEAIKQDSAAEDFTSAVAGFEYTYPSIFGSSWDVGALSEYVWDSRRENAPVAFQNDVFIGTRLAANDIAGTEILAGALIDTDRDGSFVSLEASRRLGNSAKLSLQLRAFADVSPANPLYFFRDDDYLELELIQYF